MLLIQLGADGLTTSRGATEFSVSVPGDTPGKELPQTSDGMRGGAKRQQKSCGTVDREVKATALVGRAIDAPVENNPVCLIPGRMMKQQETPDNRLGGDAGKPAVTREADPSSQKLRKRHCLC